MEICVDSLESALNAVDGGAHRLELCSSLNEGGLTPSFGLFKTLRPLVTVPIFVMLRPRGGEDYQYSDFDVQVILQDLSLFKEAGANGFVFGALTADGNIDAETCFSVISMASPLPVTFHRAFDVASVNPIVMAQKIAELGFKRLLTSGRSPVAYDGKLVIKNLIQVMKDRLIIVPGSGINVKNLKEILVTTSAREFHGSARALKPRTNTKEKKYNLNKPLLVYVTNQDIVRELFNIYNMYIN